MKGDTNMDTNFFPKLFCAIALPVFINTRHLLLAFLFGAMFLYFCDGGDYYA